ncbi:hypothetical protein HBI56_125980 [Parastagonospora nodorum]|uniref:Uncharacterized protein n=1 Tax=Phaeosphaeria nodorum (strain SN15 / ATCC MYA-4574 / FGSC 10173) TaxID=321614 RepID=A0A7U2F5A9_PHANO|nr:hypothetical protein HBH56_167340 [Parastagonospora nodorum]QRC98617.1 hypothetical protein JI435_435920 [Parastagonospora nodorum SN15]KAH3936166.1 hypothetical protein HBH54_030420 [Parastagonospora nodorum]KAH3948108.1 hypothetical protein HBH53_105210 [Parastagonospora nodorum]KAH3968859.1 hypothetical protein HBH51_129110 [Parastagonospora nodorum]
MIMSSEACSSSRCYEASMTLLRIYYSARTGDLPYKPLLVCRQINTEAALIPFQVNEFIYNRPDILHGFLNNLSANQRGLIKILRMEEEYCIKVAFEALSEHWERYDSLVYDVYNPLAGLGI